MAKIVLFILSALIGIAIGNTQLQLVDIERTSLLLRAASKVHEGIIAEYQTKINSLSAEILLQSKVNTQLISSAQTVIQNKVKNSADTFDLDISNVKNQVNTNLKKPIAINNINVRSCLNIQLLYANALSTIDLRACYNTKQISELTTKNSQILELKSSVITLGESCRSQHPLEADSSGMRLCLSINLSYSTSQLDTLTQGLTKAINETETLSQSCIDGNEETLSAKISDIVTASRSCLSLS